MILDVHGVIIYDNDEQLKKTKTDSSLWCSPRKKKRRWLNMITTWV
jgi:hypothetical protein